MKREKMIPRTVAVIIIAGLLAGACVGLQNFLLSDWDVQKQSADYQVTTSELVAEFLEDGENARRKYLSDDGESMILEITGTVARISENFNNEKVVLLREEGDRAGVSCTFMQETNPGVAGLETGNVVTIKGVIRSGAYYDEDLDMYVNVIVNQSGIVN
jgi:hypothetical protein